MRFAACFRKQKKVLPALFTRTGPVCVSDPLNEDAQEDCGVPKVKYNLILRG